MATRGKSINLFLMDGTANGRIKCTLANWTGVAYKIPRIELDKCKERDDLKQSGVYFLFGTTEQTVEDIVYIGQAGVRKNGEGILFRLQEHKRNPDKDYWSEAVVFTTSNNSFGPTEISYLENRFCNLAMDAKRYIVKNGNDPTSGHITEEKESELEEFIDYAKIVMGTLGHKVFEPLIQQPPKIENEEAETHQETLYCTRSGATGMCKHTPDGFVVLAGSKLIMNPAEKFPKSISDTAMKNRKKYADRISEDGTLLTDTLFKNPSGASQFVLGASSNGNVDWKTAEGKTIKDIEAEEVVV